MPSYNPKDAEDVLLNPGQYEGVVKRAQEKMSKSGNEMIELIVTVYDPNGATTDVFDYLVFSTNSLFKVRHFCESAGLDFERGSLQAHECDGRNVRVNLDIERATGYPDKNKIADYLPRAGDGATVTATAGASDDFDPDVPDFLR